PGFRQIADRAGRADLQTTRRRTGLDGPPAHAESSAGDQAAVGGRECGGPGQRLRQHRELPAGGCFPDPRAAISHGDYQPAIRAESAAPDSEADCPGAVEGPQLAPGRHFANGGPGGVERASQSPAVVAEVEDAAAGREAHQLLSPLGVPEAYL